jgi:hypothetical protein
MLPALCVVAFAVWLGGTGSTTGGTTAASSTGYSGTDATTTSATGSSTTDATGSDGTTTGAGATSNDGATDLDTVTAEDSISESVTNGDETPSTSTDAGADPTFGPLDDGVDPIDDTDGCCDHRDNNSDNFLCRISGGSPGRFALTIALLLLGRPRRRARETAGGR